MIGETAWKHNDKMKDENQPAEAGRSSWTSPLGLFCSALALALGLVIGFIDLHTTEVTVTILSLLLAGFFLGLLLPTAAWRWPVLIVVGLPVTAAIARLTGAETAEPVQFDFRITLVSLAFAFIGSYTGVLIRRGLRSTKGRSI